MIEARALLCGLNAFYQQFICQEENDAEGFFEIDITFIGGGHRDERPAITG
jgi:hypothetical protein